MHKQKGTVLYCFSPPVMLATFVLETSMAFYALWRYRLNTMTRLAVAMLFALGLFQLCEYKVCGGWGMNAQRWSRAGYVSISLLPPLGLHMLFVIRKHSAKWLLRIVYSLMVIFVGYFMFSPQAFQGYACTGNYVIFQLGDRASYLYGIYYFGQLLLVFMFGIHWLRDKEVRASLSRKQVQSIKALMVGYAVFLVPTALANSVNPDTKDGVPSIMCGFAVIFAIILTVYILPRTAKPRSTS